ncbi:unnamed protein product [Penicillium salamii]|nr:unnamed protein product [Penicillium salamii]
MNLLEALEVIRNASDDSLQSHAEQTTLILKGITQRLHNLNPSSQATALDPGCVPSAPHSPTGFQSTETTTFGERCSGLGSTSSQPLQSAGFSDSGVSSNQNLNVPSPLYPPPTPPSTETTTLGPEVVPSSPQTPHVSNPKKTTPIPERLAKLLYSIRKSAFLIWKEVDQKSLNDLLSRKRNSDGDPRLEHIRRIEGDKSLGNKDKFLRVLALRSLALEFTEKQNENNVTRTTLDELYEQAKEPNSPRANMTHIGQKTLFARSIRNGLKYRVFENVMADHCHNPQNPPIQYAAISAIVGLHIDQFRRLRFDDMKEFAKLVKSDSQNLEPSDQKMCLLDAVQSLNPWFNDTQRTYNCKCYERRPLMNYAHVSRVIFQNRVSEMESNIQKAPRVDLGSTPQIRDTLIEMSEPSVPSTLGLGNINIPSNQVDTQSLAGFPEPEFTNQLYTQLSNQPINLSEIIHDAAMRASFDFDHIAPFFVAPTSPQTTPILTR